MTTVDAPLVTAPAGGVALGAKRVKKAATSPWASIAAIVIAVLWTIPTFEGV